MIEDLKNIELNLPVETITVDDFKVWPVLRIYIGDALNMKKSRAVKVDTKIIKTVITSLFYGVLNFFKPHKHIFFSDTKERRIVNGIYTDKTIDEIARRLPNSVVSELPLPQHYPLKKIATHRIFSRIILYVLGLIYEKMFLRNILIVREDLIQKILSDYCLDINYIACIKKNIAQYKLMQFWIRWKHPKDFTVVCSYTNMGYVKACREKGIKVIEVQHGIINTSHYAYNIFKKIEPLFYPDYILTYGLNEKKVFSSTNFFISPFNVIPVGHYYIDYVNSSKIEASEFDKLKPQFKRTVAFTSQDAFEEKIIPFIKKVAEMLPNVMIAFIPRSQPTSYYQQFQFPKNVRFFSSLNNYQLIKLCDIHSTVSSTCAIEAPALGKPNILLNIDDRAKTYYAHLLTDSVVTKYVNTPQEFVDVILNMQLPDSKYCIESNRENILPDYEINIKEVLNNLYS